jgi:apolipoprotein D and lipocalin family protein
MKTFKGYGASRAVGVGVMLALLAVPLTGCLGMPEGVTPVSNFDAERYLGRWYEIARLDHRFERDLVNVTAEYSRRDDGAIRVVNRGFKAGEGEWDSVDGVARFVGAESEGHLKVSFFGPFYGSYIVFELDEADYSHAFVAGFNHDYLWLLAREPVVSEELRQSFMDAASSRGFDTSGIIWVQQDPTAP